MRLAVPPMAFRGREQKFGKEQSTLKRIGAARSLLTRLIRLLQVFASEG